MNPRLRVDLARLIASQISVHACMTGFRMAAPLMALREGHSAWSVGILLALFALAPVFLALPAGRFADRHGLQRPVRLAVTVASVGALAAVVWPTFWVLCLSATTCGAAINCITGPSACCGGTRICSLTMCATGVASTASAIGATLAASGTRIWAARRGMCS